MLRYRSCWHLLIRIRGCDSCRQIPLCGNAWHGRRAPTFLPQSWPACAVLSQSFGSSLPPTGPSRASMQSCTNGAWAAPTTPATSCPTVCASRRCRQSEGTIQKCMYIFLRCELGEERTSSNAGPGSCRPPFSAKHGAWCRQEVFQPERHSLPGHILSRRAKPLWARH